MKRSAISFVLFIRFHSYSYTAQKCQRGTFVVCWTQAGNERA